MRRKNTIKPFAYDLGQEDLKRERSKARELRDSQWWKRRLAKGLCHYCGRATLPKELTMDHIVPVSRAAEAPKATSCLAAKIATALKNNCFPWNGNNT